MVFCHTVLAGWGGLGSREGEREFFARRCCFAALCWRDGGDLGGRKGDKEFSALRWCLSHFGNRTDSSDRKEEKK